MNNESFQRNSKYYPQNPVDNLYQPMFQQNSSYYQNNQGVPNAVNVGKPYSNQGNYNTAFNPSQPALFNGIQPKGMFSNHGFINQGGLIHNNLYDILLHEEIREYSVLIDSKDRNYQMYPSPFKYDVKFSPLPRSREKVDGKYVTYEDPNPIINEAFANVRYIVLEDIILPNFTKIYSVNKKHTREDGGVDIVKDWKLDESRPLTEYLYVVLNINEYNDLNIRSTNDVLSDSFATIYFDEFVSKTHYKGISHNGIKIFQQDQLATITNWKISFSDPYGMPLMCNHVDKKIKSNFECTCDENDENNKYAICFRHNLFHPLNPLFQHHLHFRVGVVEPRLGKITFS
jgi:hypothetical protein